jgi:lipopolysaccharide export system protein LptA
MKILTIFSNHRFNRGWVLALCAVTFAMWGPAAQAEKADRNRPMNVEADSLRYDDLRQVSVFTGKVLMTKGTIVIRGERLEVRQDPDGYQFGVVTAAPGQLAFYRQKREGIDEYIEGDGETIEYDGKADRVKFIKRAQMRRFRGATLADEMTGSLISYDNITDVFAVDGSAAVPGASAAPGGRVKAVLAPRNTASAPVTGTPAAATPAASPTLRPSTTLGGDKK